MIFNMLLCVVQESIKESDNEVEQQQCSNCSAQASVFSLTRPLLRKKIFPRLLSHLNKRVFNCSLI